MDLDNIDNTNNLNNRDIIFDKVSHTIENSTNLIHKKALALIRTLKDKMSDQKLIGIEGVKNYTKTLLKTMEDIFEKLKRTNVNSDEFDELAKNSEALIFCLAICVKQL